MPPPEFNLLFLLGKGKLFLETLRGVKAVFILIIPCIVGKTDEEKESFPFYR